MIRSADIKHPVTGMVVRHQLPMDKTLIEAERAAEEIIMKKPSGSIERAESEARLAIIQGMME